MLYCKVFTSSGDNELEEAITAFLSKHIGVEIVDSSTCIGLTGRKYLHVIYYRMRAD